MECPSENLLAELVERRLDGPRAEAIERHLDGCESCRRVVASAARLLPGESAPAGTPEPSELPPGSRIGRYLLISPLGAGGMGVVYLAYDPQLDRTVALKLVRADARRPSEVLRARLLREAQTMARLAHPNVVGVFDSGVHEGRV